MKIRINKDIVEFTPEHAAEAAELEALWIKMAEIPMCFLLQSFFLQFR